MKNINIKYIKKGRIEAESGFSRTGDLVLGCIVPLGA